jgi:hypothetical protein
MPDPNFFKGDFLTLSSKSLYFLFIFQETWLLLKLAPATISSKKKVSLILPFAFCVGSGIRDEVTLVSGSGMKNFRIHNTASIKEL